MQSSANTLSSVNNRPATAYSHIVVTFLAWSDQLAPRSLHYTLGARRPLLGLLGVLGQLPLNHADPRLGPGLELGDDPVAQLLQPQHAVAQLHVIDLPQVQVAHRHLQPVHVFSQGALLGARSHRPWCVEPMWHRSAEGGHTPALHYSLIVSCRQHSPDPFA